MKPGIYNFTIYQGADFDLPMVLEDEDGTVNLTGFTASMQIRSEVSSSVVMAELTTENGRITLDVDGNITWHIPASVTAEMTTDGVYDFDLIAPDESITTYLKGVVRLDPEVTR